MHIYTVYMYIYITYIYIYIERESYMKLTELHTENLLTFKNRKLSFRREN